MVAATRPRATDPPLSRFAPFRGRELGEGRLEPGIPEDRPQKVLHLRVTGTPPNLLGRLLVGSYITGQDQVLISAPEGLAEGPRSEIHRVVDRTLGMSVVGETPTGIEVQNFVDPEKYELPRLLHRVEQILRAELSACLGALAGKGVAPLELLEGYEEEIDRLYLLMVRQLLLSSDNPRIARNIDVPSHHFQIGDRLLAKVLEMIGDLVLRTGRDLAENLDGLRRLPPTVLNGLSSWIERLELLLGRTMEGFRHLSLLEANACLNEIGQLLPCAADLEQAIVRSEIDRRYAVAAQRITCNTALSLEMLAVINEVTINRAVEPETVGPGGTLVTVGLPRAPPRPEVRRRLKAHDVPTLS